MEGCGEDKKKLMWYWVTPTEVSQQEGRAGFTLSSVST